MTRLEKNQKPFRMSLAVRSKVYLISFAGFILGGGLGFLFDSMANTKPVLTILGAALSYPLVLYLLYIFVRRPHDAGTHNDNA